MVRGSNVPEFTSQLVDEKGIKMVGDWLINRVKVLRPTRHKIGHFGDVLLSQSLGLVPKKLKQTQE